MDAAYKNDIPGIVAECGGSCACATCHVYVEERFFDQFSTADQFEDDMLEGVASERRPNSRLSCQLTITPDVEGIEIEVPAVQQ
ncbi:ferredoxin [Pusillimonas sp. T7-7]|nr:ferredoxin [Pusillimonas sp. T7-7]